MKRLYFIADDAVPYLVVLATITVLAVFAMPVLAFIPGILFLFVAYFFRNPSRNIPSEEGILVSPADGTILEVSEIYEDRFLASKAFRVSIFLSIFNVHLNRCPIEGVVKYRSYRPGKMLPAFKSHVSDINEKSFIGIENNGFRIMVTQITGFIARRIVCWVDVEDKVSRGDIFGLIKFGSCTEIIVPTNVDIIVKKGDKVVGGETIIGRLKK
ncbi:MAG: phosphatidylserine decarboxylase family protein [Eubacteriales bacterium]